MLYIDLRPGQTCHSKVMHRKEVTHSDGSYGKKSRRRAWLTVWDKVKSHGIVRLMHRKRVTCELHDSYFRSMTIKHAIPRTPEVIHPDGQSWGDTEWAVELLYNSVKTGSQLVWRPVGEKMLGWEHVPERLGPQTPGWTVQENENDIRLCLEGLGRSICRSLCSVSNSLSHTNLSNKVRGIFF